MKTLERVYGFLKGVLLEILPNRILLMIKKDHYLRFLSKETGRNEPDFNGVTKFVKKGDTVVDIGANVGSYTKLLSDLVEEMGTVYSIEPIPETFSILSFCVKKLNLNNVKLFNFALSDRESTAIMTVPKYDFGGYNFYQSRLQDDDGKTASCKKFSVKIRSLDSILEILAENISFIKCDVEGHELSVIKGARKIIERSKPVWLIEISSDPDELGSAAYELTAVMKTYGYNMYWFDGNKFILRLKGNKSVNYFFIPGNKEEFILDPKIQG